MITLTYFAFTSLSTVGLGDYYPLSNLERILGAIFLLFGVMLTSMVIESLNAMLTQVKMSEESFDETDKLSLFFGTLKKFNGNSVVSKQETIENYFKFRWENNKMNALVDDIGLFIQLPVEV